MSKPSPNIHNLERIEMYNKDRRYDRYQNDPQFHNAVCMIEALIHNYSFTHQDIQDAAFVACMKHIEQNPIPLLSIQMPPDSKKEAGK